MITFIFLEGETATSPTAPAAAASTPHYAFALPCSACVPGDRSRAVPEDGPLVLRDSAAILVYLARTFDQTNRWLPTDPTKLAQVQQCRNLLHRVPFEVAEA